MEEAGSTTHNSVQLNRNKELTTVHDGLGRSFFALPERALLVLGLPRVVHFEAAVKFLAARLE